MSLTVQTDVFALLSRIIPQPSSDHSREPVVQIVRTVGDIGIYFGLICMAGNVMKNVIDIGIGLSTAFLRF